MREEQVRLQRADAEHEKAAEAHGEQDHPRLVPGTSQADDRMPQWEPRSDGERPDRPDGRH